MSAPEVHLPGTPAQKAAEEEADVEMSGATAEEPAVIDDEDDAAEEVDPEDTALEPIKKPTFLDYLKSPIVELNIGSGDEAVKLSAHQALLTPSPYFAELLADETSRTVTLDEFEVDSVGCFLQYQYTGEYFPRRLPGSHDALESDPSQPATDDDGTQLLKHARVYTLAERLGLPDLKQLAHSKIHRVQSTAKGEIAYARYVYQHTEPTDVTIRKPVAAFWATRSHVLRHEAETEFRTLCLEFPQFGFDVLSLVLDQKEKRAPEEGVAKGSARKRARQI